MVIGYGRDGMMTYELDDDGVVTVDEVRGTQTLDYGMPEGDLPSARRNKSLPHGGWNEATAAAIRRLRADGWPLD